MHWIRFEYGDGTAIGRVDGERVAIHEGDLFDSPRDTGESVALGEVRVLTPCQPSKMICLWNNFRALAAKLGMPEPPEPLFLLKAPSAFIGDGDTIRRPGSYDGPVVYEGELGIVIGKRASGIAVEEADRHIFGYTCINDVTAAQIINRDATFAQWARAKSFDTFGVFGPSIATDLDTSTLVVRTVLNGDERQNYPVSDMIFSPRRLVSLISHDMTLLPGDIIACGTSLGVGSMKEPSNTVSVTIDGIGTLTNSFVQ